MKSVTPQQAHKLWKKGACFVDVRESYEHNAEKIEGSRNLPLSAGNSTTNSGRGPCVFYCNSGERTYARGEDIKRLTTREPLVLEGGITAWKLAGYPTVGGGPNAVAGANLLRGLLRVYDKDRSSGT